MLTEGRNGNARRSKRVGLATCREADGVAYFDFFFVRASRCHDSVTVGMGCAVCAEEKKRKEELKAKRRKESSNYQPHPRRRRSSNSSINSALRARKRKAVAGDKADKAEAAEKAGAIKSLTIAGRKEDEEINKEVIQ